MGRPSARFRISIKDNEAATTIKVELIASRGLWGEQRFRLRVNGREPRRFRDATLTRFATGSDDGWSANPSGNGGSPSESATGHENSSHTGSPWFAIVNGRPEEEYSIFSRVNAQRVRDRGIEIRHGDRVLRHAFAGFIRRAMNITAFSCHHRPPTR